MADQSLAQSALDKEKTERDTLRVEEVDTHDVADATEKTVATGEQRDPVRDFIDYQEYRVNSVIVRRVRDTLYQISTENLVQRQDLKYQGFEWVLGFSWINRTDSAHTYEHTLEEGLSIREGEETENNFNVSASFKGLGVSAGGYVKNFSERETSSVTTIRKTVVVPAQSTIYLYQKRYNFLTEVWWWQYVPGWANFNHFRVGANGTYQLVQRTAVTSILSQEYATTQQSLSGSTTISAQAAPPLTGEPTSTRQFMNITSRAKGELRRFGVTG